MSGAGPGDLDVAETRARAGFIAVEQALRSGDPTPARRYLTDAFHDQLLADLKQAQLNSWKREAADLGAVTASALAPASEPPLEVTTVVISGQDALGWRDGYGTPVESPIRGGWSQAWSMVRSADPGHIAGAEISRCQECGAPLPEVDDGRCPFCRVVLLPLPGEWAARGRGKIVSRQPGATQVVSRESTTRSGDTVTRTVTKINIKGLPPGIDPNHLPPDIQAAIDVAIARAVPSGGQAGGSPPPAPPPLPSDPADMALAGMVWPPLAAIVDGARSSGEYSPAQPYMSPAAFEQLHALPPGSGPAGQRQVVGARRSQDGQREILSLRVMSSAGTEDWILERWQQWGPDAGWLISAITVSAGPPGS